MVKEHNLQTNEIIDREMNDAEFKNWRTQIATSNSDRAESILSCLFERSREQYFIKK